MEPQQGIAVSAQALSKVYGRGDTAVAALSDLSIHFMKGQFASIMGPSGSGKSTLMHCLAGLDKATSGQVFIGSTELTRLGDTALTVLRRERIGFVFQAFNLMPNLTAKDNILMPLKLAKKSPDKAWLDHVVSTLGLGDRLSHKPAELSGGQQQRVAMARALITRPDVIFADEPTGALDSRTSQEMLNFLRHSADKLQQTIVMVTHDPRAASYSHRVVFLADGRIRGEIQHPTQDSVLSAMRQLGE